MPYEIAFARQLTVADTSHYSNPGCWGGDVVINEIAPLISERFESIRTGQEYWGWYIWFRRGRISLAVNVFCDDLEKCEFLIHLYSHVKTWKILTSVVDTPDLEEVLQLVRSKIETWAGSCEVVKLRRDFSPLD
jgi:hypothetical protein